MSWFVDLFSFVDTSPQFPMADNGHKMQSQMVHIIIALRQATHRKNYSIMMSADALLPKRRQTICNHHADLTVTTA